MLNAETWDMPTTRAKTSLQTELTIYADLFHHAAMCEQFRLLGVEIRGGALTPTAQEKLRLLGVASTAVAKYLEEVEQNG